MQAKHVSSRDLSLRVILKKKTAGTDFYGWLSLDQLNRLIAVVIKTK